MAGGFVFPFHTTKIIHFCVLPNFGKSFFDRPALVAI
nr:MAG TPA: hypothetical protein [Caudoviricetes sp.]